MHRESQLWSTVRRHLEPHDFGYRLEDVREVLRGLINSGYDWSHKKPMSDKLVDSIIEELINDVQSMAEV